MALYNNVEEADKRENRGQGIEPHPERPRQVRPTNPQHDHTHRLKDELQKNANNHQSRDYVRQGKKQNKTAAPPTASKEIWGNRYSG